jgi:hypothetical protein
LREKSPKDFINQLIVPPTPSANGLSICLTWASARILACSHTPTMREEFGGFRAFPARSAIFGGGELLLMAEQNPRTSTESKHEPLLGRLMKWPPVSSPEQAERLIDSPGVKREAKQPFHQLETLFPNIC